MGCTVGGTPVPGTGIPPQGPPKLPLGAPTPPRRSRLARRLAAFENMEQPAYAAIPYFLLVFSIIATLLQTGGSVPLPVLGFTLLTAAWIFFLVTIRPHRVRRPVWGLVYYAGLILLTGILVVIAPWFGIFAWLGYLHGLMFLTGRWRFAGVVATAVVNAMSQVGGGVPRFDGTYLAGFAALFVVNLGLAGTLSYFALAAERQNEERVTTITELAETNRKLQEAMAENAGLHAQLLAQAREAGILDERQRMAREIHDTLAQGLTGIITQLQAAQQAGYEGVGWQRHIDNATHLARESLSEARRSVQAIRPEALETARLPEALAEVAERWSGRNSVVAEVTTTGTPRPLHPEVEMALLRTAQEALANVAKHAQASRVGLTLSYMEDVVTLDVRDDGVGFVPDRSNQTGPVGPNGADGHFGLTTMRQRVQRLAGHFEIESEPGGGTALSAVVPAIAARGAE
ncbi:sensor histidine kinase [Actinopolymorpha pittospori]|uniref:Signal transduction histidine kinase n=1 Tax=Actinopolymorpha pittospori TaxID=648752 RepID=A0A927R720_9ACTN|nr:sensor histidine kinase [Actinopolymorpha pittospori]MBE1605072.1 signal transduction histidine kinase [Actinopolymorpha pittospori]